MIDDCVDVAEFSADTIAEHLTAARQTRHRTNPE
jgi:hypothetical protein